MQPLMLSDIKLDNRLVWCDITRHVHIAINVSEWSGFAIAVFVGVFLEHNNLSVLPREAETSVLNHSSQTSVCISEENCGMWKQKETRLNQSVFPGVVT